MDNVELDRLAGAEGVEPEPLEDFGEPEFHGDSGAFDARGDAETAEPADASGGTEEAGEFDDEEALPPINPDIKWFVIHTYSGYENKVKANIEKVIENRGMQEVILDIVVPMEEQIEIKDGRKKVTLRKVFPGYVLIKMLMTDETWYVVRNTRGVTGFVGPGSKPTPLSEADIQTIGEPRETARIDIIVGDEVRILNGLFENFVGKVNSIDIINKKVSVMVPMLKRETAVELEYDEVVRQE